MTVAWCFVNATPFTLLCSAVLGWKTNKGLPRTETDGSLGLIPMHCDKTVSRVCELQCLLIEQWILFPWNKEQVAGMPLFSLASEGMSFVYGPVR